jgi:hypothetical protein
MVRTASVWTEDGATKGAAQTVTRHKNDAHKHNSQLSTTATYNTTDRTSIPLLFLPELVPVVRISIYISCTKRLSSFYCPVCTGMLVLLAPPISSGSFGFNLCG